MSALSAALAAFATSPSSKPSLDALVICDHDVPQSSPASPSSCYSALPSLTNSSTAPSSLVSSVCGSESYHQPPSLERRHEHLAVLLPKSLWKPDRLAARCDNFYCHVKFSIFGRRHVTSLSVFSSTLPYALPCSIVENVAVSFAAVVQVAQCPSLTLPTLAFSIPQGTSLWQFTSPLPPQFLCHVYVTTVGNKCTGNQLLAHQMASNRRPSQ
jgi:hypothetical protein